MIRLLIIIVVQLFLVCNAFADVSLRGFQVGYQGLTEEDVRELATEWNVNLVRIQVGNNGEMDGTVGADYIAMMERELAVVDEKLELFRKYGLKVVLALYSPPGGFQTRVAPSHYEMFSNASLQGEFITMWQNLISRYGNDDIIYAFDLLNEPAEREGSLCADCDTWTVLATKTINTIRSINPNVTLMLKSRYGNPGDLTQLPLLDDPNIIYSYHAYPFNDYQHAGIGPVSRDIARPNISRIESGMKRLLRQFFVKAQKAYKSGKLSFYPPRLNVGEFAVSACSTQTPEVFLDDLLSIIEGSAAEVAVSELQVAKLRKKAKARKKNRKKASKRKKRKKKKTNKKKRKKKKKAKKKKSRKKKKGKKSNSKNSKRKKSKKNKRIPLEFIHESWTNHAFSESAFWDPRSVCNPDGSFSMSDVDTARGVVLKRYLARN